MPDRTTSPASTPSASTTQLRRVIRSGPRTPGRTEAFAELVSREPRGLDRTLSELALDPRLDPPIRAKAVVALGRHATPVALRGLRLALDADDTVVVQRAIERLGKVGDPTDVERLRDIRTGNRTTQRVLRAAKCFLSYRHRLGEYRVDQPKQRLAARSSEAQPLRTGAPTAAMRNRMELVAPAVPGLRLDPEPARRILCGSHEFAVMLNRDVMRGAAESLAAQQGIPGVVVMFNDETGVYEPAYWLLSDPSRGARFRIAGVRSSGRVGLAGTGVVEGDRIMFELNATESPLDHPMTIEGSVEPASGRVRFDTAVVEPRFSETQQRRRRQPRAVTSPER